MNTALDRETCPLCDVGTLQPRTDHVFRFSYKRKSHRVEGLEHAVCDHCGSSLFLPGQMSRNKTKIDEYQRSIVGSMGPQDIVALREKYMITQAQAACIFGCGQRAFSKWERGEVAPTAATAKLLRLAFKNPAVMKALAEDAGVAVELPPSPAAIIHSMLSNMVSTVRDVIVDYDRHTKETYEAGRRAGVAEGAHRVWQVSAAETSFADVEAEEVPEELLWHESASRRTRVLN